MRHGPVYTLVAFLLCGILVGCGTTKWTDTRRSATEQLLISDAMDRAVSDLDLRSLAGQTVYLDSSPLSGATDSAYLVSSMRQHMLASGVMLKEPKTEADYVLEVRAGAVGTDRHELVYGVPQVNIPALIPVAGFGIPSQIPEIPLVKRDDQRAVVKLAVFAYNRTTGRPVWQSGVVPEESDAKATWVFGAGPFQQGKIYEGANFAGDRLRIPLVDLDGDGPIDRVSVAAQAYFNEPGEMIAADDKPSATPASAKMVSKPKPTPPKAKAPATSKSKVVPASHTPPLKPEKQSPEPEPAPEKPAASQLAPAEKVPAEPPQESPPVSESPVPPSALPAEPASPLPQPAHPPKS